MLQIINGAVEVTCLLYVSSSVFYFTESTTVIFKKKKTYLKDQVWEELQIDKI